MLTWRSGLLKMEKFSKLDQNQRTSMTNTQSQLKDKVMWLDIFLKEGLHISPKPFCIFYVQAMATAVGLSNGQKSKLRRWRRTTDSLHTSFFWRSKICWRTKRYFPVTNVKIKYLSSFFFPFVTVNVWKSESASAFFGQRTEQNARISKKFELSSIKHKSFLSPTQGT